MMDDKLFQELASSINEAGRIRRGTEDASRTFEISDVNVRSVRDKTGLSQPQFASLLGVSAATLRNWEQGRRQPTGPARALLRIVKANPRFALETLHAELLAA
jgi:putative transcriptional regulator